MVTVFGDIYTEGVSDHHVQSWTTAVVLNSQPICGPLIKERVGPASVRFQD